MARRLGVLLICLTALVDAQRKPYDPPTRHAERGLRGAIGGGSGPSVEAGMRLFYQGGNAVDAGVAATLAGAVFEFSHFGFGGEAPILIRTRDGKVRAIAGVGAMPKLATAEFFRQRRLLPGEMTQPPEKGGLRGMVPVAGLMPALVPGMVDAVLVALKEYGTKSFAEAVQPAIELADGAPLDETRASEIERSRRFIDMWPTSRRVFLPEDRAPRAGEVFRQPDLARTLRSMAAAEAKALSAGANRARAIDAVRDHFYRGDIARRIDVFCRENRGLLRYEDMAAFHVEPEEPVSTTFHGYTVYKAGFWTQGPSMIEALNLIEPYDLRAMRWNSTEYIHTLVEALKLAYADRDTYYGDPKFAQVPAERLLSKEYAAERRKLIGKTASLDFRPGKIGEHPPQHPSEIESLHFPIDEALMAKDTTCVDAVDKDGVMFSSTPSGGWLPSVIAGDTGIPLTSRAQSFLLIPGHPNELAGGKRPRVTLSPTLVTRDGKAFMAVSTPGGDNQDQALLQAFLNTIEFGMSPQNAVEAPRFETRHLVSSFNNHAMSPGDMWLDDRLPATVVAELTERHHRVGTHSRWFTGAAPVLIRITPGGAIEAGADPYRYREARAW